MDSPGKRRWQQACPASPRSTSTASQRSGDSQRGWGVAPPRAHARGGYEPGLGAKGATHIVGGILAMNGVATLKMAAETFGLQALLQYLIE